MTKREILLAICENPGWEPPVDPPSSVHRALEELNSEGWIMSRLDGWEATPRALTEYPEFSQQDIADNGRSRAPTHPAGFSEQLKPQEDGEWEKTATLKIGQRQNVVQELVLCDCVKGQVSLGNSASHSDYEAEVTVKLRRV